MSWYYAVGQERNGPVSDEELDQLVQQGTVTNESLVWQEGMADWQPYGQVSGGEATGSGAAGIVCAECGNQFNFEDVLRFGDQFVCAGCKPIYVQRMQEGGVVASAMDYAGFWVRFAATFIDGIIQLIVIVALFFIVGDGFDISDQVPFQNTTDKVQRINIFLSIFFYVFFLGKFGATPGKMALGLKVVRSDGSRITYLRAFGRFWANYLSSIILCIGYLMVAFDRQEHKALHDRICDTRVIRT
jgi:uncharacterized RDD family membrane protein YckC